MASHYKRWTEKEDVFLWENYVQLGVKECAKRLKRSTGAVTIRYMKLYGKRREKNDRK